jgi:hypothetical protein
MQSINQARCGQQSTMAMVDDARNMMKVVGLFSCTGCRTDRLLQQHIDDSLRTIFTYLLEDGGCGMWHVARQAALVTGRDRVAACMI